MPPRKTNCSHDRVQATVSPNGVKVGFQPYTKQRLFAAATGSSGPISSEYEKLLGAFPAPLILPGDDLSYDPKERPQSFKSWLNMHERRATQKRRTVYIAAPPKLASGSPTCRESRHFMRDWHVPRGYALKKQDLIARPTIDAVTKYLEAFFHGLEVRQLPDELEFAMHSQNDKRKGKHHAPDFVDLRSIKSSVTTPVRVRHMHASKDNRSRYPHQLYLNDILDHAIAVLPDDAYCLLFLVDHDLFEDESDDFCCGRAYGGSRIAVVSSAQYQPALDVWHGVEIGSGHFWPGSHCKDFVDSTCGVRKLAHRKRKRDEEDLTEASCLAFQQQGRDHSASRPIVLESSAHDPDTQNSALATPIESAVDAHRHSLQKKALTEPDFASLYLRRLALTASHELLHCVGLGHCVYLACAMQGTASIVEDSRQPPYLCIVCENKLAKAVTSLPNRKSHAVTHTQEWWSQVEVADWKSGRNRALLAFCEERGKDDLGFASLGAWTKARLVLDCS